MLCLGTAIFDAGFQSIPAPAAATHYVGRRSRNAQNQPEPIARCDGKRGLVGDVRSPGAFADNIRDVINLLPLVLPRPIPPAHPPVWIYPRP